MNKLKITIINPKLGIFWGGSERLSLNLACSLSKRGHQVKIIGGKTISKRSQNHPQGLENYQVNYIFIPYLSWISHRLGYETKAKWLISSLAKHIERRISEEMLYQYLKSDQWSDIFQITNGYDWLGSRLAKLKPTLVWWPGMPSRINYRYLDEYHANIAGGDIYSQIRLHCHNARKINLGIDINRFKPVEKKKREKRSQLLFVGRLIKIKNLLFLLKGFYQALQEEPNLFLNIVGTGPEREKLEKAIQHMEIQEKVLFHGERYDQQLISVYQQSDVFIIVSFYESFSMATLEAMACGCPVIASKRGYLKTLVKDGENGFLIKIGDVHRLKQKIIFFHQNKGLTEDFNQKARRMIVNNYNWDDSVLKCEKLYFEFINS